MQKDGFVKVILARILAVASFGIILAGWIMLLFNQRNSKFTLIENSFAAVYIGFISLGFIMFYLADQIYKSMSKEKSLAPIMKPSGSSPVAQIERFSHYVARQLGFKDESECPELMKLAYEYLKTPKECDEKMYEYLRKEENAQELYKKLVQEFERCILGYFSFHWRQTPLMITLCVNSDQKNLKKTDVKLSEQRQKMAATSHTMVKSIARSTLLPISANPESQSSTSKLVPAQANTTSYGTFPKNVDYRKFEKISEDLKLTRISTLVEEVKVIGTTKIAPDALSESPVLLLMGGGIGAAGKSIVLKDIMKESFWSGAIADVVVVEADAFNETDAIYRDLGGNHQGMLQTTELVHQSSTDAASSLLNALNKGCDVIMDGTLSWIPFFEQTIRMTRNVHKHRYRMGEGYQVSEDGTVTENYWEQIEGEEDKTRNPYRIELVGVACDANLAVVRGIRRAIQMDRAVKVKSLLKSHKRFASAFPRYYKLVDKVKLYCTNAPGGPPKMIARKDGDNELLDNQGKMKCFNSIKDLNGGAETINELYKESDYITQPGSVWKDIVLLPERGSLQLELKTAIQKIEVLIP